VGLRLGSALLAPQAATSPAQSAIEGADEAALETALCALRQLKSRALLLRDEARRAQQDQHALEALRRGGASGSSNYDAATQQSMGLQLRRDLKELAAAIRQETGAIPVILARCQAPT
jgi:hypothetical protein